MCDVCGSRHQSKFRSEVCVHFAGPQDLYRTPVVVFPELTICLNCGTVAAFQIEELELVRLRDAQLAA